MGNQRKYMDWLAKELKLKTPEDWKFISRSQVISNHGATLLTYYGGTIAKLVAATFPELDAGPKDGQSIFSDASRALDIKELADWYRVTTTTLKQRAPALWSWLQTRGISLSDALQLTFPDYNWLVWRFEDQHGVPKGYWTDTSTHKKFFDWVASELSITDMKQWYLVPQEEITDRGGWGLVLNYYNGSHGAALASIYPEHQWDMWRFTQTPKGWWEEVQARSDASEVLRPVADMLAEKLQISSPEEWYRVSAADLAKNSGSYAVRKLGGLYNLLALAYPNHKWQSNKFARLNKKSRQRQLIKCLQKILPGQTIIEEFREPSEKARSTQSKPLEFDAFIPSLQLAFEYQGKAHTTELGHDETQRKTERDIEKRRACLAKGITLIEVYEADWDGQSHSETFISQLIQQARPDLERCLKIHTS